MEKEIASQFIARDRIHAVRPYGKGLINDTFLVETNDGQIILQRINRQVFQHPRLIMENLRLLTEHFGRSMAANDSLQRFRLPRMLTAVDGKNHVIDPQDGFWRAQEFIPGTTTLESIASTAQAEEVGFALGRFHALTHDLDPALLHNTLPGFHDAPAYFARFLSASSRPRRVDASSELLHAISFVEKRRNLAPVLEQAKHDGKLVTRPVHGDTKLNNFLFDEKTGKVTSLIDLDTVQPGLIHFDIGDCLRSCANPAGETPEDPGAVRFDLDIAQAVLKGYFSQARGFLTTQDHAYLYDAIRLIPFELGLRFLTDHLEGDCYFKTEWPGHNLHRALVQFQLATRMEANERSLKQLLTALTRV